MANKEEEEEASIMKKEEEEASLKKKEEEEDEEASLKKKEEEEASLKKKEEEEDEEEAMGAMQEEEILKNLVGFRFHPTNVELVAHYLQSRTKGSCKFLMIQECDIYKFEPWNLPCDSFRFRNENKEMYFFTPRHPSSGCPQRASRAAGYGYWKGYGKDRLIKIGSTVIGHKTALTYKWLDANKEMKTNWIMHEFLLEPPSSSQYDKKFQDLVLCRIHEKKKTSEENDDAGLIVEERQANRKQAEGPEKQSLMDETGSLGWDTINNVSSQCEASSSHSTPRELQPVNSFKISDFLRSIVKKALHLGGCRTDEDVSQSSKIRNAADEGNNSSGSSKRNKTQDMDTCHSSPSGSSGGRGRARPHGSSLADKDSAHCGRVEDDFGTDSANVVSQKKQKFQDLVLCRIHEKKNSSEENDDAGLIVEERQANRKQVEGPEKQSLMDETCSLGSDTINNVSSQCEASSSHSTPRIRVFPSPNSKMANKEEEEEASSLSLSLFPSPNTKMANKEEEEKASIKKKEEEEEASLKEKEEEEEEDASLKNKEEVVMGGMEYFCRICLGKPFSRATLTHHNKVVHSALPVMCRKCLACFSNERSRRFHRHDPRYERVEQEELNQQHRQPQRRGG